MRVAKLSGTPLYNVVTKKNPASSIKKFIEFTMLD